MRSLAIAALVGALGVTPTFGQSPPRLYGGIAAGTLRIDADEVRSSETSSVGFVAGLRLTRAFSLELELNQGLGEASRSYSGWFFSFAGPGATREEVERLAVTMQSDTRWTPGFGWSALAVLRSTNPQRVGIAVFGGVTRTHYDERRTFTILNIPEGVNKTEAELHRMEPDSHLSRTRGGLTGGVLLSIRLIGRLSIAPEIRFTYGSFGDEIYTTSRAGARLLWGF